MEKVFFARINSYSKTKQINKMTKTILTKVDPGFEGKIPLKVHFGEKGNITYIKPENYEDFSHLNTQNILDNFNDKREDYLSEIYENSCTNGCIFPLTFSGVPQEINLSGLSIDYVSGTQQTKETNFYD